MKRKYLVIISVLLLSKVLGQLTSIDKLLSEKFEFKKICSGDNIPNFNTNSDNLKEIIVLLHYNISNDKIMKHFGWSETEFQAKTSKLIAANFIKRDNNGIYKPNFLFAQLRMVKK